MHIQKKQFKKEPFDVQKIECMLARASKGLSCISIESIIEKTQLQIYDSIKSSDLHEILIKVCADFISESKPDYQYMAGRLGIFKLRKQAFGAFKPPELKTHVKTLVDKGIYDQRVFQAYIDEEFDQLEEAIDHERDMNFSYAAVKQLEGKYLVQDRVKNEHYETPQIMYMLISACLFAGYPKPLRLDYVIRFYHAISTFKISLPTPIMAGVRTPLRHMDTVAALRASSSTLALTASRLGTRPRCARSRRGRPRGSQIRRGLPCHLQDPQCRSTVQGKHSGSRVQCWRLPRFHKTAVTSL